MKPFDLEAAKAGAPVITRDGRKALLLYFNLLRDGHHAILGLVDRTNEPDNQYQDIAIWMPDGTWYDDGSTQSCIDLFMAATKREGWVGVLRPEHNHIIGRLRHSTDIYETSELAKNACLCDRLVDIVKIEWEE